VYRKNTDNWKKYQSNHF